MSNGMTNHEYQQWLKQPTTYAAQDLLIAFLANTQGERMEQRELCRALLFTEQELLDIAEPLIEAGDLHRFTLMTGTWYSVRGLNSDQDKEL